MVHYTITIPPGHHPDLPHHLERHTKIIDRDRRGKEIGYHTKTVWLGSYPTRELAYGRQLLDQDEAAATYAQERS